MNTAARIIDKFGGVPRLARILEKPARTVQSWKEVGRIPAQHQQAVLDAAKLAAIPLAPSDFFHTHWKEDGRAPRGAWAPGGYLNKCRYCEEVFLGDKRALECADCAYK